METWPIGPGPCGTPPPDVLTVPGSRIRQNSVDLWVARRFVRSQAYGAMALNQAWRRLPNLRIRASPGRFGNLPHRGKPLSTCHCAVRRLCDLAASGTALACKSFDCRAKHVPVSRRRPGGRWARRAGILRAQPSAPLQNGRQDACATRITASSASGRLGNLPHEWEHGLPPAG